MKYGTKTIKRGAALLAAALLLTLAGCTSSAGTGEPDYASYDLVVTAWDTPQQVLDAVRNAGVTPFQHFDGDSLLAPGDLAEMGEKVSVYLCEGSYEAGDGDFILTDGSCELTVTGAGAGKTVVNAGGNLRKNTGSGLSVSGGEKPVKLSGLTLQGFRYGVLIENASGVELQNVELAQNNFAGLRMEAATGCTVTGCTFSANGGPGAGDVGYGLSLDDRSTGNTGTGNVYSGNGNANAVDYPSFWATSSDGGNSIELELEDGPAAVQPVMTDPVMEAQNARPGPDALRYEMEQGGCVGAGIADGDKMEAPSEGQYVYLFDGTITLRIDVPEAGSYRLFVVGGSDDGNDKCDYIQVNGGPQYLTSFPGEEQGVWQLCQPGTEFWSNGVLLPLVPTEGFALNEGENEIVITANWGYSVYDCIYIEKIQEN